MGSMKDLGIGKLNPNWWPVPSHCSGGRWSVLLGRHRGKTAPSTLERVQFEKVLPLGAIVAMNVLCCNYFFFFFKCIYVWNRSDRFPLAMNFIFVNALCDFTLMDLRIKA